ncbi:hypothetical protein GQ43DRAFT_400913 [Delitschia confertaspora ATCC 74209]|uniref:Pheromone-regulated membrane protein 6 n=1 Tax=Delitschia confertaspora ATCC 74209 TaxID=1513339 RepID=A0A9P4JFY7_9PLEO|nr:hypothetical protein GQ43DRAFT_400913 [Delitschia confertaspora ATCC 74209]
MGCCGDREKGRVSEEQKWDYIVRELATLSDFKSSSCLAPFSYIWLWILVIVSVAVYAADAYTCITLLAFNKWTGQVKPKVDFHITKWIFAICIIISYVFLVYRWIRAMRVIRSGGVAESYLDPLAAVFQSIRMGKNGQGYRRFLVFAELTKSKKGVDYIALFVYFQFQGALIIILAQGPRIVVNALTLWAVMDAKIIPKGENAAPKGHSPVAQFFLNIESMAEKGNTQETIIYFTMLFSLVIWVIAALSLFVSVMFYIFFLWHYVPSSDGRLSKYCRRKIEARLERIVSKKVKKALEKQDLKRRKEEQQALKDGDLSAPSQRAPTLPKLGGDNDSASVFSMPQSETTTLAPYSSQPPSRNGTVHTMKTAGTGGSQPTLPYVFERPAPVRTFTQGSAFSTTSYHSNAPLLEEASGMGRSSPPPAIPSLDQSADYFHQGPSGRRMPPLNTQWSSDGRVSPSPQLISPLPSDLRNGPPLRTNSAFSANRYTPTSPVDNRSFSPYEARDPTDGDAYEMSPVDNIIDEYARHPQQLPSQLPSALRAGTSNSQAENQHQGQKPATNDPYRRPSYDTSLPPSRSGTAPPNNPRAGLPAALQSAIQRREASNPLPNRGPGSMPPPQRSATAPMQSQWGLSEMRSASAAPQQQWGPTGPGMRSASAAPGARPGPGPMPGQQQWESGGPSMRSASAAPEQHQPWGIERGQRSASAAPGQGQRNASAPTPRMIEGGYGGEHGVGRPRGSEGGW